MNPINFNHIIPYYSPISSSGGKKRQRKHTVYRKNKKTKRSKTRRYRRN